MQYCSSVQSRVCACIEAKSFSFCSSTIWRHVHGFVTWPSRSHTEYSLRHIIWSQCLCDLWMHWDWHRRCGYEFALPKSYLFICFPRRISASETWLHHNANWIPLILKIIKINAQRKSCWGRNTFYQVTIQNDYYRYDCYESYVINNNLASNSGFVLAIEK